MGLMDHVARLGALGSRLQDAARGVAPSRYDVVLRHELMELRRYRARGGRAPTGRPVLLVPPLMARSFVFDLHAQRSLVQHLLDAGLDVFLVDWGDPGPDHRAIRIEDYVLRWLPRAIEAAHAEAGRPLGLVGYCLGGLFGLWHLGLGPDPRIDRLALIATPVDARRMGPLMGAARLASPAASTFGRVVGNVPGPLSAMVFQMTTPLRSAQRWFELWAHAEDPTYIQGFAAMNAWMGNFSAMPRGVFVQLAEDFLRDNASFRGRMRIGGRRVDLARVRVPVLAIAGDDDRVVAPAAVHAVAEVVGSELIRCVTAPGGHAGVIAGACSVEAVWAPIADWMAGDALRSVA